MGVSTRREVLAGRAGVQGVRTLLYGKSARHQLRQDLMALLLPPASDVRLRLERAKLKPDRKLTGYYLVDVSFEAETITRAVEVTWSVDSGQDAELQAAETAMEGEACAQGVAHPFRALRREATDLGARIRVAPLDVAYPHLVRLYRPDHVRNLLTRVYREAGEPGLTGPAYAVTAVRYRPRQRHVLRYHPVGGHAAGSVYAKVYRDGLAAPALRIATAIADRVEGQGLPVAAARPLGGSVADDALLFSRLVGAPLTRSLWIDSAATGRHLLTAGALLRRLQTDPGELTSDLAKRDFEGEVRAVSRAAEHVGPLEPALGQTVVRLLDGLRSLNLTVAPEEPRFAHGDYKSDHLWVARDKLTLLDFDTCCVAEPALDVGKFLADLTWWHAVTGRSGRSEAQQRFLEGYGATSPERLARARLYEVLILTKIIIRRLRRFEPDWTQRTAGLLQHAELLLDLPGRHARSIRGSLAR